MRTKNKRLENQFKTLCSVLGKRIAVDNMDKGAWTLEYIAEYGGYQIREMTGQGGETMPFGPSRYNTAEMDNLITFSLRAIQIDRLNGADSAQSYPDFKEVNANNPTEEFFTEAFADKEGNPEKVPPKIRRISERLCKAYGIRGICDPMYIANVIAFELELGDGQGNFNESGN